MLDPALGTEDIAVMQVNRQLADKYRIYWVSVMGTALEGEQCSM